MNPILTQISGHPAESPAKRAQQQAADDGGFADLLDSAWDFGLAAREIPKAEPEAKPAQPAITVSIKDWDRLTVREQLQPPPLEMPVEAKVETPSETPDAKPITRIEAPIVIDSKPAKNEVSVDGGDPLAVLLMPALPVMARTPSPRETAPGTPAAAPLRIDNPHAAMPKPVENEPATETVSAPSIAQALAVDQKPAATDETPGPAVQPTMAAPAVVRVMAERQTLATLPVVDKATLPGKAPASEEQASPQMDSEPSKTTAPASIVNRPVPQMTAAAAPLFSQPIITRAEPPALPVVPAATSVAFQSVPASVRIAPAAKETAAAPLEAQAAPAASAPPAPATFVSLLMPTSILALDPAAQPELLQAARKVTEAEVTGLATDRSETLKLQLKPAELGSVTATLHAARGVLSVDLVVETAEALHRLKHEADAIGQALRDLGLEVDKVSVQASLAVQAPDRAANVGQPQNQMGNQAGGDAGASFEARGDRSAPDGRHNGQRNDRERSDAPNMAGDGRAAAGRYI